MITEQHVQRVVDTAQHVGSSLRRLTDQMVLPTTQQGHVDTRLAFMAGVITVAVLAAATARDYFDKRRKPKNPVTF